MSEILAYVTFWEIVGEIRRDLLYHVVSALDLQVINHHWEDVRKQNDSAKAARGHRR